MHHVDVASDARAKTVSGSVESGNQEQDGSGGGTMEIGEWSPFAAAW